MVYKENFVAVVKCEGSILREKNNIVTLPFGSEYSLLLKNLDSKRCNVNVSIDGQDVLDGSSLLINPNSELELHGFLKDNIAKNKFKFIQKTKEIQNHRGDRIDDGMIRIEFAFEKQRFSKQIIHEHHYYHHRNYDWYYPWYRWDYTVKTGDDLNGIVTYCSQNFAATGGGSQSISDSPVSKLQEDEGITVKGNEINQQFYNTTIGELEPSKVIIINLRGIKSGQAVNKPITVKTKLSCPTCGRKSKSNAKFCSNCGTFLE